MSPTYRLMGDNLKLSEQRGHLSLASRFSRRLRALQLARRSIFMLSFGRGHWYARRTSRDDKNTLLFFDEFIFFADGFGIYFWLYRKI
jgi:hypothetical protein